MRSRLAIVTIAEVRRTGTEEGGCSAKVPVLRTSRFNRGFKPEPDGSGSFPVDLSGWKPPYRAPATSSRLTGSRRRSLDAGTELSKMDKNPVAGKNLVIRRIVASQNLFPVDFQVAGFARGRRGSRN